MAGPSRGGGLHNYGVISAGGDVTGGNKTVVVSVPLGVDEALRPVADVVACANKRAEAEPKLLELKIEAAKGKGADDQTIATLVDSLIELVPEAADAVTAAFTTPVLGHVIGGATRFVLGKLRGKKT